MLICDHDSSHISQTTVGDAAGGTAVARDSMLPHTAYSHSHMHYHLLYLRSIYSRHNCCPTLWFDSPEYAWIAADLLNIAGALEAEVESGSTLAIGHPKNQCCVRAHALAWRSAASASQQCSSSLISPHLRSNVAWTADPWAVRQGGLQRAPARL